MLTKEEFASVFVKYMLHNGHSYDEWDIRYAYTEYSSGLEEEYDFLVEDNEELNNVNSTTD